MPLLGAYSDVRGRAPVYALCVAVFAAGSVVTATAGTLPWLVAGRVLQGLGGGGLVPLTLALAADLYEDRVRTVALGSVSGLQEAGSVLGPIYGATLASPASRVWALVCRRSSRCVRPHARFSALLAAARVSSPLPPRPAPPWAPFWGGRGRAAGGPADGGFGGPGWGGRSFYSAGTPRARRSPL